MDDPKPGLERLIWWLIVPLIITIGGGLIINQLNSPRPPALTETSEPPPSNQFFYVVNLISQNDKSPIANADLILAIDGQRFPLKTDLTGQATFQIPRIYAGQTGRLNIEIDGDSIGFVEVVLSSDQSPWEVVIDLQTETPEISEPTATHPAVATATLIAEEPTSTPMSSSTPTKMIDSTATPSMTSTPASTPTVTSVDFEPDFLIVTAPRGTAVNVYTRASSVTGAPRAQIVNGDVVEILEEEGDWYRVQILKNGIEGWVENEPDNVQLFNGTPPASAAPTVAGGSTVQDCIDVIITRNIKSNDIFDDVTLNWQNPPAGTVNLQLWVKGVNSNGAEAFVVQPTFSDLGSPYTAQQWMFEEGDFTFDSTFTFFIVALNNSGDQICQTVGTFKQ